MRLLLTPNYFQHEAINLASRTITNIAGALKCVVKVKQGKACSKKEVESSLVLMHQAYKASQARYRAEKISLEKSDSLVSRLLLRISN